MSDPCLPSTASDAPAIDVALATYNGAEFLAPFLESLLAQTHRNFTLVVSDDGSTDDTLRILDRFADRLRIRRAAGEGHKGVVGNFENALRACSAPYVALADQDDVWRPEKLSATLSALRRVEVERGVERGALVYCDLALVDSRLNLIAPSFFDVTIKSRAASRPQDYAFGNHAPGCCTMFNRALLQRVLPLPPVRVHDWWIILVAAIVGSVEHLPQVLIDYRQHSGNCYGVGAAGDALGAKLRRLLSAPASFFARRLRQCRQESQQAAIQWRAVRERFGAAEASRNWRLRLLSRGGRWSMTVAVLGARSGLRIFDRITMILLYQRRP